MVQLMAQLMVQPDYKQPMAHLMAKSDHKQPMAQSDHNQVLPHHNNKLQVTTSRPRRDARSHAKLDLKVLCYPKDKSV